MCASLTTGKVPKDHRMMVWGKGLELSPGDLVMVESASGRGSIAALLLFGFPLLGFFLGLLCAPSLLPLMGLPLTDGARFLMGMVGMTGMAALVAVIHRFCGKGFFLMHVLEKKDRSGGSPCVTEDSVER